MLDDYGCTVLFEKRCSSACVGGVDLTVADKTRLTQVYKMRKSRLGKSVLTFAPSPKELGEGLDNSRELKRP